SRSECRTGPGRPVPGGTICRAWWTLSQTSLFSSVGSKPTAPGYMRGHVVANALVSCKQRVTAVDDEDMAAHHLGVGRAQKRDCGGDVLGLDHAARGRARAAGGEHLLPVREVLERARLDEPGGAGVDPDLARRQLDREVAHDRLERR